MRTSNDAASFQSLLEHLRLVHPVSGIVHVGSGGAGQDFFYGDWDVRPVLLVEADEKLAAGLARALSDRSDWRVLNLLIGAKEGPTDFFVASNPNESGIIAPEALRSLWRNLRTREARVVTMTTLDALLQSGGIDGVGERRPNWVIVHCLPVAPVLEGASTVLESLDVVMVRAVVGESGLDECGASRTEIDDFLVSQGFRCLASRPELQPAVAMLVYARDWKACLLPQLRDQSTRAEMLEIALQEQMRRAHESADELQRRTLQPQQQALEMQRRTEELQDQARDMEQKGLEQLALIHALRDDARAGNALIGQLQEQAQELLRHDELQANELTQFQARVDGLEQALQAQMQAAETAVEELQQRTRDFEGKSLLLAVQLVEPQEQIRALRDEALAADALIGRLREQAEAWSQTDAQYADQLAQCDTQLEALRQDIGDKDAAIAAAHAQLRQGGEAIATQGEQLLQCGAEVAALRQAVADLDATSDQGQSQIKQMGEAAALLAAEVDEQRRQTLYWKASHDAVQKLAEEAAQRADLLVRRVAELENESAQQRELHARLSRDHDEHARVSGERLAHVETLVRAAEEQGKRIAQLERERSELDARQRLLDQEIVKAEAQIELIKDVVLREKAF